MLITQEQAVYIKTKTNAWKTWMKRKRLNGSITRGKEKVEMIQNLNRS